MTRCLLVTSIFAPIHGGSAAVYHNLARHADGEVVILAPWRNYQTGQELRGWQEFDRDQPYRIWRTELLRPPQIVSRSIWQSALMQLHTDLPLKARLLARIARLVRREGIRVLCIGELDSGSWIGPFARQFLGCRIVNYIHGEEITAASPYRRFGRNKRRYLARADAVIAVSEFTRRQLAERMGVDPRKVEVIPNGIDTQAFRPREPNPELRRRYGLPETGKVLLSVGRLIERKGFDRAIEALAMLRPSHPDLHYLIVGTGPFAEALGGLAREAGVADRVVFAGSVPDRELADHYALADLFLLPNRTLANGDTEGFGLVLLEANACGKPVVAGRDGGVAEVVRDGVNGLSVDGNDPARIAAAVERLLTDGALYARLREGGLRIAEHSAWQGRARQFQDLCRKLMECPAGPEGGRR